jgi:Flp pilus assembly protein TadD
VQIKPDYTDAQNNLGITLMQEGRFDEAVARFQDELQINPEDAEAYNNLGSALLHQGQAEAAIACFHQSLKLKPDYADACDNLAWVLATVSKASLRDGNQAVELAGHASQLAGGQNPQFLRTLAAAEAGIGQFDKAMQTAQAAIKLAQAAGKSNLVDRLNSDLKLYRAGLSFPSGN